MPCCLVPCSGRRGVHAPADPAAPADLVTEIPGDASSSSTSDASSRDSEPKGHREDHKMMLRAAVLAVKACNRLALPVGGQQLGDGKGSAEEEEEVEEAEEASSSSVLDVRPAPRRRTTKRSSLVEQLRCQTQRLTFRRATQTLGVSTTEQLRELMDLLKPGMPLGEFSDFAKAYGDEAFCGRLLRKYPDNVPKCADKLRQALVWREQNKVLLTSRKCPQAGDYRVIGADSAARPVLYMCMRNQLLPLSQCVDFMVVAMLRAVDNMPPGVETTTHIWDLHGMMIRLNWNPAPLIAILKMAEGYFAERMHQLIIVDMPRMAAFLKDAVWPLVPEKTREKVKFMTADEAQTHVGNHCPADVAGRIRGSMQQNRDSSISLEERKRSWMRVDEHGELTPAFA